MVMIRVYAQHRRDAGVNSLVTLRDTRWGGDQQIIATMEIDLTTGIQMVYIVPDIMMTVNDFANHVEISVQTHGYDNWQAGESNLLITRMVIGRLSNTSNTNFEYSVDNVADYLASHGVLALPGTKYTTEELQGRRWILRPSSRRDPHNPTHVETRSLLDGGVSLAFRGYRPTPSRPVPPVDSHDLPILPGDEDEEQLLAILTFTGDPQYLEPDPVYDTESSDDSFYDDSDSDEESTGPQPDNGLSCEHPWASDPCPAHAIWEENRSGNCPKAFWRSYQPPPSFDAPMPDPAQASWGPDFDDAPTFDPSPPVSPEEMCKQAQITDLGRKNIITKFRAPRGVGRIRHRSGKGGRRLIGTPESLGAIATAVFFPNRMGWWRIIGPWTVNKKARIRSWAVRNFGFGFRRGVVIEGVI
ncbi:hypothetical protein FEM48_Zijuj12G0143000 [Ziziphus jujuba var. spinosa]|uniref:Uncharacterized protein n=1 Tax=Ziziphus jujuba var. spinosa TaxID=714518 RepID=A0A978UDT8_ZIZJJ|nr:hypothetical protein FEM48_Zijuj12G0142700 [Ziziphus jujuba var. spinosa]KAH7512934.1 hypothetical protein FEM48_Zijuj12G0143000 [Ziziphus jujuba var. spinosa]